MVPLVKLVEGLRSPGAGAPAGLALSSIVEGTEAAGEDPLPTPTGLRITPGLLDTPGSPDALQGSPSRHLQAFAIASASLPLPVFLVIVRRTQQLASALASAQVRVQDESQVWTCGPNPHPVPARGDVSGLLSVLFEWLLILIG